MSSPDSLTALRTLETRLNRCREMPSLAAFEVLALDAIAAFRATVEGGEPRAEPLNIDALVAALRDPTGERQQLINWDSPGQPGLERAAAELIARDYAAALRSPAAATENEADRHDPEHCNCGIPNCKGNCYVHRNGRGLR